MRYINLMVIISLCVILSGCAAIFNPYNSEFSCPETNKGACVSTTEAYKRSLTGEDETNPDICKEGKCTEAGNSETVTKGKKKVDENAYEVSPENVYRDNLFRELSELIEEPETPIVAPPAIVRILMLSYPENSQFYGWRYVFFMDGEPKWIYGTHSLKGSK